MKNIKISISILVLFATICSCNLLDLPVKNNVEKKNFYKTENDIKLAVTGAYGTLASLYYANYVHFSELPSDNVHTTGESSDLSHLDKFSFSSVNSVLKSGWQNAYRCISNVNEILEAIPDIDFSSKEIHDQYLGEALFIRALSYFNLVRMFGDLPLVDRVITQEEARNMTRTSAETIYFTTRIDNKSPSVTLVGFSNEMVTLSSSLNNLISEELLLNQSKWLYPDNPMNGLYAVFKIDDQDSGTLTSQEGVLSNGEIKYGIDGESETQYTENYPKSYERIDHTLVNGTAYSETGYRMEFKYDDENGNVYTYELTGYTTYISGAGYYAQVKMFDTNKLKTLPGLYDSTQGKNGIWNVTTNTYFRYKIGVSDFIGNIGYANLTDSRRPNNQLSSNPEWDNRVLRYYVDPFGIEILSTEFYEINGSDWDDDWIYTEELSDIGKEYIMTSNRNSGWASRYVVGEVKLATGLSEVTVDYRYQDMTGKYTESGEATGDLAYSDLYEDKSSKAGGYVLMNKKTAWVVFSNANTKDIQVAIGARSPAYNTKGEQINCRAWRWHGGRGKLFS